MAAGIRRSGPESHRPAIPSSRSVHTQLACQRLNAAQAMLLPHAPASAQSLLDHYCPWTAQADGAGIGEGLGKHGSAGASRLE